MCPKCKRHFMFNIERNGSERICDHLKRKIIYTLSSYNIFIPTSRLKLGVTIFHEFLLLNEHKKILSNSTIWIICRFGGAHNRTTHILQTCPNMCHSWLCKHVDSFLMQFTVCKNQKLVILFSRLYEP